MRPDELVTQVDGLGYDRPLERADLPDDATLAVTLPALAGHPRLPAVTGVLCGYARIAQVDPAVLTALCETVLATAPPSLFGDSLALLLDSQAALTANAHWIGIKLLTQGAEPAPEADAAQVLRAADALEGATRLRLGGFCSRFDLLALLDGIAGPAAPAWARAATRSILACIELWPDSVDLLPALERLAGIAAPLPKHAGVPIPDDAQESDFASALARVELLRALRAQVRDDAVDHLDRAQRLLAPARADDERPDIEVLSAIVTLVRDLLMTASVTDIATIATIKAAVAEHAWLDPGVNHWTGDRVAASHAAWAKLAAQLDFARNVLAEKSWLYAAAVLDNIVDLYRTTRSMRAFRRSDDDEAVLEVIAPMIESGFAAQAALLHHLDAYTAELTKHVDAGTATERQAADLPIARDLLEVVTERARAGDADPKHFAGADEASPSSGSPAEHPAERIVRETSLRVALARFSTGSLIADAVLETARSGLAGSVDYRERHEVAAAADLVTCLLVSFLYARERATESMRPYLFDPEAEEEDLAADLQDFLVGCGQLGGVRTEVRRVSGGRVDIEFAFPGFNLYVELKADTTAVPLVDRFAYQRQTAAYQTTDPRVGFLLVLKIIKPKVVPRHLSESINVVEIVDDGGGRRHVVALTLSGGRTTPSSM